MRTKRISLLAHFVQPEKGGTRTAGVPEIKGVNGYKYWIEPKGRDSPL
jgi:hypothetical protein